MKKSMAVILLSCVMLVTACSIYKLGIEAGSDPFKPVFIFEGTPEFDDYIVVCVYEEVKVCRTVWRIRCNSLQGKNERLRLSRIEYGVVPDGFEEKLPPKKLEIGRVYCFGYNRDARTESSYFKIIEKDGKPVIQKVIRKSGEFVYLDEFI